MPTAELFEAVITRKFGKSICFLCGCRLGRKNRSDEHVFPKWLQNRYSLANEKLRLLNQTEIAYRQLTVPCCRDCNTKYLHPIETAVSRAVARGPNAVRALGAQTIFIWLGKIFYGVLYQEMFLRVDRSKRTNSGITTKEQLQQYASHHLFLQSVRVPLTFKGFFPASIEILKTQEPRDDPRSAWDFSDDLHSMFIGCRMGTVGIVCMLQDGGAQRRIFPDLLRPALSLKLHPLQFREVMAKVRYQGMLLNKIPQYLTFGHAGKYVTTQAPLQGYSTKPIFDEWDQRTYAQVLAHMTGIPAERLFLEPDRVWTWLRKSNGTLNKMIV